MLKQKKYILIGLLVLGLVGVGGWTVYQLLRDKTPPTITVLNPEVDYGKLIPFSRLADVSDDSDKAVKISIENDDVRNGILIEDSEEVLICDKIGTFELKISATDSSKNKSEATVIIKVTDQTAPKITDYTKEFKTSYGAKLSYSMEKNEEGFYVLAEDKTDLKLSVSDIKDSKGGSVPRNYYGLNETHIIFNIPGTYTLYFSVTDSRGNASECSSKVEVRDDVAPVFENLKASYTIGTDQTEVEDFSKVKAIDKIDGDLTESIKIDTKSVKFGKTGTYTVKFSVKDKSGNKATKKVKLYVADLKKPVIDLTEETITLKQGSAAPDYSKYVIARDEIDGDLNSKLSIDDSKVNYKKPGSYQVVVSVSDSSGNSQKEIIQVVIEEAVQPQPAANSKPAASTQSSAQ